MTKDEALKLALEALELTARDYREQRQAINAIREALAQPEQEPLTDEEIADLWNETVKYAPSEVRIKDFARAIEAAHGIKE